MKQIALPPNARGPCCLVIFASAHYFHVGVLFEPVRIGAPARIPGFALVPNQRQEGNGVIGDVWRKRARRGTLNSLFQLDRERLLEDWVIA